MKRSEDARALPKLARNVMGAAIDFARSADSRKLSELECEASSHRLITAFLLAGEPDLCFEFDAGLLHFPVGQQPDE